jgi:phosphoribosylanthranilate isomerase
MIRVKVCGITNLEDALAAVQAGADALGFNFWPGSSRYIEPTEAGKVIAQLPRGVIPVGVFVNEPNMSIREITSLARLRMVQLHGEEPPEEVTTVAAQGLPVLKAIRVGPDFRPEQLAAYSEVAAFLLDTASAGERGGTGKSFDWELARKAKQYGHIVLAGGLNPENVEEAVRQAQPSGVDVCSGVESRPGVKDQARLREFVERAKAALEKKR